MPRYMFAVSVECDNEEQATTAMLYRIGPDDDYGFDYQIEVVDGPVLMSVDAE